MMRSNPLVRGIYKRLFAEQSLSGDWVPALDGVRSQFLNLLDHMAVLESSLNWRLYGVPANLEHIKLEQLPILSGIGVVEQSVNLLAQSLEVPSEIMNAAFSELPAQASVFFVDDGSEQSQSFINSNRDADIFSAIDPHDIFVGSKERVEDKSYQNVVSPLLDAAARFTKPEFNIVWFSAAVERLTPIQIQSLFLMARKGILAKGCCAGYFADFTLSEPGLYWADPRRLRPLTKAVISLFATNAGFKDVGFKEFKSAQGIIYCLYSLKP
jgi:hypothetical protein